MNQSTRSEHADTSKTAPREVRYEHSRDLADLLERLNASLLISTYQAGKLAVAGVHKRRLTLSFHNFEKPMGVAVDARCDSMAVASRDKIWFLENARDVASRLEPRGTRDTGFFTRKCHTTGEIQAHEMGWGVKRLWIVNTLFSCLCTLDNYHSFVPQWRPPFISELAPEDRCHLNGMAMHEGRPKYVTAMAETDVAEGWRSNKVKTGCLIDVETNSVVARGFAMPHSPRIYRESIWLLDSGRGSLVKLNPRNGEFDVVARFPGYTRGLAFAGKYAFVGLSKIRETSTFGGVPIAEDRDRLKCGVGVVDLETGELAGQIDFTSGVSEIFDVRLIQGSTYPALQGPFAKDDGEKNVWIIPMPRDDSGRSRN